MVVKLNVSGPFHTELLESAAVKLGEELERTLLAEDSLRGHRLRTRVGSSPFYYEESI